jgi:Cdc6-like AAA superfamily ATPase
LCRGLLGALHVRHAYVNCTEASRPRPLLCSLLHQLKGGKRQRDDGYDCGVKCDNIGDFRMQLSGALQDPSAGSLAVWVAPHPLLPLVLWWLAAISLISGLLTPSPASPASHLLAAAVGDPRRGTCWLVLDSAHRLAGSYLLSALLRMAADTRSRVGVLLLGTAKWNSGDYLRDMASVLPPEEIQFGSYGSEQMQQVGEWAGGQVGGPGVSEDRDAWAHALLATG